MRTGARAPGPGVRSQAGRAWKWQVSREAGEGHLGMERSLTRSWQQSQMREKKAGRHSGPPAGLGLVSKAGGWRRSRCAGRVGAERCGLRAAQCPESLHSSLVGPHSGPECVSGGWEHKPQEAVPPPGPRRPLLTTSRWDQGACSGLLAACSLWPLHTSEGGEPCGNGVTVPLLGTTRLAPSSGHCRSPGRWPSSTGQAGLAVTVWCALP